MRSFRILGLTSVVASVLALVGIAPFGSFVQAALPNIPREWYEGDRRVQGDQLTFCTYENSRTTAFDRAVAEQLAALLLVEPNFYEVDSSEIVFSQEDFFEELFIVLTDYCDAFLGLVLQPEGYPEWMTFSRPYYYTPYVLAVTDEEYARLSDIPQDRAIGTQLLTIADVQLISYMSTLPKDERWRRYPYTDEHLLVERLVDRTVAGALIWEPDLYGVTDGDPVALGIRIVSPEPLSELERPIGIALRRQDAFLRSLLDDAIDSLVRDGMIDKLLEETETSGRTPTSE